MNSKDTGLRVSSIVFALMALVQLARLLLRPEVTVAGRTMPLWPSVLAFAFMTGMSLWLRRLRSGG